jgi:hypothetical protein
MLHDSESPMLTRLVYHSENHLGANGDRMIPKLNAIMDVSVRNNARDKITGALLFDTLWFLQILEGEREIVSAALRRIVADERHSDVTIMEAQPIAERGFGQWSMGIAMLRGEQAPLLERHGLGARLDPRRMSGDQAVALARDLSSSLQSRMAAAA